MHFAYFLFMQYEIMKTSIYLPNEKITKAFVKEEVKIAKSFYLNKITDLEMSISRVITKHINA